MSTRPTARQQAREQTMQRILEISRTQLETHGVAGLSLREVTRELGMVSSAVYRYVAGRDELLTLLLVDAYEDLANTVDAALAAPRGPAPVDSPVGSATASDPVDPSPSPRPARERLLTLALAMRDWAVAHRAQWTLLYGTPVAEYHAPAEATTAPGTRVIGRVLEIVVGAQDGDAASSGAGSVPPPQQPTSSDTAPSPDPAPPAPRPLSAPLAHLLTAAGAELGTTEATAPQLARAAAFFSATVGALNAELFTQWGPQFTEHGQELFTAQIEVLLEAVVD